MFSFKKLGTALVVLAATTTVNAQTAALPDCAKSCVGELLGGQGGGPCGPTDGGCICNNKELISNLSCCVFKACDQAGQQATVAFAKNICTIFKVPDSIPEQASCPEGSDGSDGSDGSGSGSASPTINVSTILAPGPVLTQPTSGYTSPSTLVVPSAYGGSVSINTAEYASQASENSAMASSSEAMQTTSSSMMQTGSGSAPAQTSTSSAPPMQSSAIAARHEFGVAGALVAAVGGVAAML